MNYIINYVKIMLVSEIKRQRINKENTSYSYIPFKTKKNNDRTSFMFRIFRKT